MKTHYIEVTVSPETGGMRETYTQLNTPKNDLYVSITGDTLAVGICTDKPRVLKFNLREYFKYELTNIYKLSYDMNNLKIGFVYDADGDNPTKIVVNFLRFSNYRDMVNNINKIKLKARKFYV